MAQPKCPACSSHSFEIQEFIPEHSRYKLYSVQCSSCGAVVGVLEYMNTESLIDKQTETINKLQESIETVNNNIRTLFNK